MQIPTRLLAGLGVREEVMEYYAEEVAGEDGADKGLVAGGVEGGGFGCEEDELDYGAEEEEDY